MDDALAGSIFSKIIVAIFVVVFLDLVFVNWWILKKANSAQIYTNPTESVVSKKESSPGVNSPDNVDRATEQDIGGKIDQAETDKTVTESKPVVEPVVIQTPNKEIFVPLGSGQAKDDTFVDLHGVEVSIDTTKYTEIESVMLEASIWVEGSNGRAWAQLKNVTDNNPLIESQISNTTSTPTLKSSGNIPLANGLKTYRVQVKSELEEYFAYVESARLKIVLK